MRSNVKRLHTVVIQTSRAILMHLVCIPGGHVAISHYLPHILHHALFHQVHVCKLQNRQPKKSSNICAQKSAINGQVSIKMEAWLVGKKNLN